MVSIFIFMTLAFILRLHKLSVAEKLTDNKSITPTQSCVKQEASILLLLPTPYSSAAAQPSAGVRKSQENVKRK